jgi:hypothetical protein
MQLQSGLTRLTTEAVALPAGLPVGKKAEKGFKIGCTLWTLQKGKGGLFSTWMWRETAIWNFRLEACEIDRWNVF